MEQGLVCPLPALQTSPNTGQKGLKVAAVYKNKIIRQVSFEVAHFLIGDHHEQFVNTFLAGFHECTRLFQPGEPFSPGETLLNPGADDVTTLDLVTDQEIATGSSQC